jgi:hypothetical protein
MTEDNEAPAVPPYDEHRESEGPGARPFLIGVEGTYPLVFGIRLGYQVTPWLTLDAGLRSRLTLEGTTHLGARLSLVDDPVAPFAYVRAGTWSEEGRPTRTLAGSGVGLEVGFLGAMMATFEVGGFTSLERPQRDLTLDVSIVLGCRL